MRILIITYYWPPSGGGGVQRWLKLSKYLPEYSVKPIVYTPKVRAHPYADPSLLTDVHAQVTVWKKPIWTPHYIFQKLWKKQRKSVTNHQSAFAWTGLSWQQRFGIWVRANLFIPDACIFWVWPSVRFLAKKLKKEPVDVVISSGPPHSMHLIGMGLQRRLGVTWWADFRDCWTKWDVLLNLRPSMPAMALHRHLERKVIRRCDKLITVSQRWAADFEQAGATSTMCLPNGYDDADLAVSIQSTNKYASTTANRESTHRPFRLLHLGSLNGLRTACFWEAITQLCCAEEDFASQLEIVIGGVIDEGLHRHITTTLPLSKHVRVVGYVPHAAVFNYYYSASVLLLFSHISPSMAGQIPGKLFEYLAVRKPILAMGQRNSEVATILQQQNAGVCVDYNDTANIVQALQHLYSRKVPLTHNAPHHFSRRAQAHTLAKELHTHNKTPLPIPVSNT